MLTRQIYGLFVWLGETTIICYLNLYICIAQNLLLIPHNDFLYDPLYVQCLLSILLSPICQCYCYQYNQLIKILHIDCIIPVICSSDGNMFQKYVILWLSSCCILAFAMAKSAKTRKWMYTGSVNGKSAWKPKFLPSI